MIVQIVSSGGRMFLADSESGNEDEEREHTYIYNS